MQPFELNIFIDCPRNEVYDQLAEPLNMIGLRPRLTTIDVMKEQIDATGILLRPFYTVETYRWAGLPVFRSRIYLVIHLTRPKREMTIRLYGRLGIRLAFHYEFHEVENGKTHLIQRVEFEKVNRLIESFVYKEANRSQRAVLTNLKVRLEK